MPNGDKPRTLIVGASSGIGAATATVLGRRGHRLVLVARREEKLATVAADIVAAGGEASTLVADITDPGAPRELVSAACERLGGLDHAFNNAGALGAFRSISEQGTEDWEALIRVNLTSIAALVRAELAVMTSGASIVNTSSWLAHGVLPGSSVYSATKAALDAFTRSAALESAGRGIRVNSVNPGGIDTAMTRLAFPDGPALDAFGATHPLGRLGTPTEVAEAVAFLLSASASNITGHGLVVDGGYTLIGQRGAM